MVRHASEFQFLVTGHHRPGQPPVRGVLQVLVRLIWTDQTHAVRAGRIEIDHPSLELGKGLLQDRARICRVVGPLVADGMPPVRVPCLDRLEGQADGVFSLRR